MCCDCEVDRVGRVGTSIGTVIAISFLMVPSIATTYMYSEKLHEEILKEPQDAVHVGLFGAGVAIASLHSLLSLLLLCSLCKNCCLLYLWAIITMFQVVALVLYAIVYFRTTAEIIGTCVAILLALICCVVVFSQGTKLGRTQYQSV